MERKTKRMTPGEAIEILIRPWKYCTYKEEYGLIREAPLIDATLLAVQALQKLPLQAHWIQQDEIVKNKEGIHFMRPEWVCSNCHREEIVSSHYCPNCGAEMIDCEER